MTQHSTVIRFATALYYAVASFTVMFVNKVRACSDMKRVLPSSRERVFKRFLR